MCEYQEVFRRYEKKYLLKEQTYRLLAERLQGRFVPDEYGESTVCNIYFDTPDNRLVRTSIEGPVYKEKLRLRSYGVPRQDGTVFVEMKKKYRGIVYKRRADMTLEAAEQFLYKGTPPDSLNQIGREILWSTRYYSGLRPAMYLCCDRTALVGADDPNLRITFDSRLLWRQSALHLEEGAWGIPLLPAGTHLMEIKIPDAMPVWLADILDGMKLYPTSFSKYGAAYRAARHGKERKESGVVCCA